MFDEQEQVFLKKLHLAQEKKNTEEIILALRKLAEFYYNQKQYERSQRALLDIIQLNPKEKNIYYYLSIIYVDLGDSKEALSFLEKELKNHPKNKDAIIFKGQLKEHTRIPIITFTLFVLNIIIYFLYPHPLSFVDLAKYAMSSFSINISSLITSIFLHVNIIHLIMNLIVLLIFGNRLEKKIGSINFLFIYLFSGIIGNWAQAVLVSNSFVIGASAALFGIMGALLMREPLLNFYFLGIFRVPIILFFGGFFSTLFVVSELFVLGESTIQIAHLIGLLSGILLTVVLYSQTQKIFYNWLIIAIGFWLTSYSISQIFFYSQGDFVLITTHSIIIFISSIMIFYSYVLLKTVEFKGGNI